MSNLRLSQKAITAVCTVALAMLMPVMARAACIGNCGTDTANGDVTAPPGSSTYQYVTTLNGPTGGGTLPGVFGSSGVSDTNGSTYTTSPFSAAAGELIDFNFNFVTSDGSTTYPDYAWAALMSTGGGSDYLIFSAQTQPSGNTVPGQTLPALASGASLTPPTSAIQIGTGFDGGPVWNELGGDSGSCYAAGCGFTGWINSQFTGEAAGNYVLAFGVSNATDTAYETGLAFSGAQVGGKPIENGGGVPEPSTLALLGAGFLAFVMLRRRRAPSTKV